MRGTLTRTAVVVTTGIAAVISTGGFAAATTHTGAAAPPPPPPVTAGQCVAGDGEPANYGDGAICVGGAYAWSPIIPG